LALTNRFPIQNFIIKSNNPCLETSKRFSGAASNVSYLAVLKKKKKEKRKEKDRFCGSQPSKVL